MMLGNKSHKVYLSPDEIPVWNWYKAEDGNLMYLMKLKDYSSELYVKPKYKIGRLIASLFNSIPSGAVVISHTKFEILKKAQQAIIYQLNEINTDILEAQKSLYLELMELLIDINDNSTDFNKRVAAMTIVGAMTITVIKNGLPDMNWLYEFDVTQTRKQRKQLNEIAHALSVYKARRKNNPTESDSLEDRITKIEIITGVSINSRKCSLSQYKAYEKAAMNKLNAMNHGNR